MKHENNEIMEYPVKSAGEVRRSREESYTIYESEMYPTLFFL